MKKILFLGAAAALVLSSCNPKEEMHTETAHNDFQWQVDRFADIKVLRCCGLRSSQEGIW